MADTDTAPATPEPPPWLPARAWAVPLIITVWVWTIGWLPLWAQRDGHGFPPPLMMIPGVALGLTLGVRARIDWTSGLYAQWLPTLGTVLSAAIGVGTGGWWWLAATTTPWAELPLLVIGGGIAAILWWLIDTWLAPVAELGPDPRDTPAAVPAPVSIPAMIGVMVGFLDDAGMQSLQVLEHEENRAGHSWLIGPRHVDAAGTKLHELPDFDDFTAQLPRLRQHMAAWWRPKGVTFTDTDIRPEPLAVDRWWLHANTKHPERQPVEAAMTPPPRRWSAVQWLGLYLDGPPMEVSLASRHVKVVGSTGGGKSVVANNLIRAAVLAQYQGRRECHVWVVATDKVVPLVWPWLEGYLSGRHERPVLDRVAGNDPASVLRLLAAAYRLARSRNEALDDTSSIDITPDTPGLLIVWEEANHGGACTESIEVDGEAHTISSLVNAIMGMSRSSGVSIAGITQQGLYEGTGPYGDQMMRNFTVRIVTVTETDSDGTMTLPKLSGMGVDTTLLRNHTVYCQPSMSDDARAMPGKVSLLDGTALISGVAGAAAALPPPRWSASDLAALGEDYATAWDPANLPLLLRACVKRSWPWRFTDDATPPAAPAPGPAPQDPPPPPPDGGRVGTREHTVTTTHDDPWDRAMGALLAEHGVDTASSGGTPGMPTDADVDRLQGIADQMAAEVDGRADEVHYPAPMGELLDILAAARDAGRTWMPTSEMAQKLWDVDPDDIARITALGRVISAYVPDVRATGPRAHEGGRGRGYVVEELGSAIARRGRRG